MWNRPLRKPGALILLGMLAGIVCFWTVLSFSGFYSWAAPRVDWRTRLVTLKLRGSLPYLGWRDLARMTAHSRSRSELFSRPPAFEIMKAARAEGACPVLWDTSLGPIWGHDSDGKVLWATASEQIVDRDYDQPPVSVQKGDVVLDVGSHLGTFTRYALRRGAKLVVAFEPEPTNTTCYKRTFRQEMQRGEVLLVEAAAWHRSGTLQFAAPPADNSGAGSAVREQGTPKYTVRAVTVDETVRELNLSKVDFIKMDIEGAERNALEGARETLDRFGPRMAICIYHLEDDPTVIPRLVLQSRQGYSMFFSRYLTQVYFH